MICGVGGAGRPAIGIFSRFPETGVVTVPDDQYAKLMHIEHHKVTVPVQKPVVLQHMEMDMHHQIDETFVIGNADLSPIQRMVQLEGIIKRSKNHMEVLNAKRELALLNFRNGKHKKSKSR